MQELARGIHRLLPHHFRPAHTLFQLPSRDQGPQALLITCSDFGIAPHSLIPTNTTDLYVLQNIGNMVAAYDPRRPDRSSSIETTLELYPIKDIIICGHWPCGVIHNFLAHTAAAESPRVAEWLHHGERTRTLIAEHYGHLDGDSLWTAAVEENVLVQLERARTIPAVAERLDRGTLHLHGWVYKSRKLFVYDPHQEQFVSPGQ